MITRMQIPRQLRNKGGITNAVPREKYGLGSKLKERFRKLIPNELADIAVKAAPFVAPFNPGIAGLMRGIGRFDQRGSISDAFKQGFATYGFGKAAGYLGGAKSDPGIFGRQRFSMEDFREGPVGRLFKGKTPGGDVPGDSKIPVDGKETKGLDIVQRGVDFAKDKIPLLDKVPDDVAQKLLVGTITSGASALYSYFAGEFDEPQQPGETMGEYMARRNARVKQQMRSYMDSYYTPLRNPEYASLTPEQRDNFIDGIVGQTEIEGTTDYGYATGGRVGYQTGGVTMANTLAENIRRNLANQAAVAEQFKQARANIPGYVEPVVKPAPKAAPIKIEEPDLPISKPVQPPGGDVQPILPVMPDRPVILPVQPPRKIIPVEPGPGGIDNLLPDLYEKIVGPAPEQPSTPPRVVTKPVDIVDLYEKVTQPPKKVLPVEDKVFISQPGFPDSDGDGIDDRLSDEEKQRILNPDENATLMPIEPITDQQILEGFAKFKEQNPEAGAGPGLQVMIYGRLPDGTPLTFGNSAQAAAFNQYLESIGQPPFERSYQPLDFKDDIGEKSLMPIEEIDQIDMTRPPGTPSGDGALTVMPQYNDPLPRDELLSGFEQFKKDNPEVMQGFGTAAIVPVTLPGGYSYDFSGSLEANAFRKYLESIGQAPYRGRRTPGDLQKIEGGLSKLAGGGMPVGIMRTNKAGVMERDYRDKGGFVPVGIKEKADDVPAMLSKNEFVFTADAVRGAGGGSIEKGAQRMYNTMKNLEKRVV
jgi:hypothetical protein